LTEITRAKVKAFVGVLNRKTHLRTVIEKVKNEKGDIVKKDTVVERPLSKSTLRIITASLRACLNHACDDELIVENPAKRLTKMFGQAKHMHEKIEPLAPSEVPLFLRSAKDHAPEYYAMFLTLLHTGVRSRECAGLQWGDIDFAGRFIIVRRTVTASGKVNPAAVKSERLPYRIEKTKTDRIRRIDISNELLATLELHRKECLKKSLKEAKPLPEWVFANKEGNPLDMHNIKNKVPSGPCESQTTSNTDARPATQLRQPDDLRGNLAGIRSAATWARQQQDDGRHLHAPDSWLQP
jgi:integrase